MQNNSAQIYLSSVGVRERPIRTSCKPYYTLESFYYIRNIKSKEKKLEIMKWLKSAKVLMIDSGAFTMFKTGVSSVEDCLLYIDDYIDFINEFDIEYFFELDIDSVLGYDKVLEFRERIESGTGKPVILVWHENRGINEFYNMCSCYNVVAVGSTKEVSKTTGLINKLCDIGHSMGCWVHGLGFSGRKMLNEGLCPFDSVDSTNWNGAIRRTSFFLDDEKKIQSRKCDDSETRRDIIVECHEAWSEFSRTFDNTREIPKPHKRIT